MCSLLISPPSLFNKVPSDSWTTGNLARTSLTVAGAAAPLKCIQAPVHLGTLVLRAGH